MKKADSSYLLKRDSVENTYLWGEAIISIAKSAGVAAIIPGYGFLSESADFAEACKASGPVRIGPTPEQMRSLGLKHLARNIARACKVPLLPGTGLVESVVDALVETEKIGYSVMVK